MSRTGTSKAARLANISDKEAAKAFQKAEWQTLGQVESHLMMVKPGIRVNLSVPQHKKLSVGGHFARSSDMPG